MIDSFIPFDLSLFLKTQYPTHAHIRVPPHSIVSPAYASGNPSTRNRVLRPAPLTPETFHHLGTSGLKGFTSPPLVPQPPTTAPSPCAFPQAALCTSVPRFIPPPPLHQHPEPHLSRAPRDAAYPSSGSASRTLWGLRRGKELHRRRLLLF